MRITPIDVRTHRFGRRLSGLDPAEVESFLQLLSEDYEDLLRESGEQTDRVRHLEQRVEQLVGDERLLKETLVSAQAMTQGLRDAAIKESEILVGQAEVKAEKILDAAHRRAARLGEEIREMRGFRTRMAEALRATIETHLKLVDSIEVAPEDEADGDVVTYLARTAVARDAARQTPSERAAVPTTRQQL